MLFKLQSIVNLCVFSHPPSPAGTPSTIGRRPTINGAYTFLAGWLDQSYTPDGLYAFASDAASEWDVAAAGTFGLNSIRLHQKLNSDRWYAAADRRGVVILQDFPQKYGGGTAPTVTSFLSEAPEWMDQVGQMMGNL